jgi:hypothetical protein
VRDERAREELYDPPHKRLALADVEARDLPRCLSDVLDVRVQRCVLTSERLCRTHLSPPLLDS